MPRLALTSAAVLHVEIFFIRREAWRTVEDYREGHLDEERLGRLGGYMLGLTQLAERG